MSLSHLTSVPKEWMERSPFAAGTRPGDPESTPREKKSFPQKEEGEEERSGLGPFELVGRRDMIYGWNNVFVASIEHV